MPVDCSEQEAFTTRVLREHPTDASWVHDGLPTLWKRESPPGWYGDWVVFERERLSQLAPARAGDAPLGLLVRQHVWTPPSSSPSRRSAPNPCARPPPPS